MPLPDAGSPPEPHPSAHGCSPSPAGGETRAEGYDLLRLRWVRALVTWPLFPYVFQAVFLAAFVGLAVLGQGKVPPEGVPDKLYAKSNLVNLVIWGLWWPAMVWAMVLVGRVWCAVCPLELVSNVSERLGRRLGIRQMVLAGWLRAGGLVLAGYVLLQLLVAGVHLHRVPGYTSWFLWIALGAAVVAGLLWKDRAFCRGFCPVGLMLAVYGRGGMLAVRPRSGFACDGCQGKDCVRPDLRTRPDARSCPSLLNPGRLDRSNDCLVCGQCVKVCAPGNMGLLVRRPFSALDAREVLASWPVTLFVMAISGFVVSELCSEWESAKTVYLWVPTAVSKALAGNAAAGWIEGLWTIVVVPALVWPILGGLVLAARGAPTLADAWRRIALPVAVLAAAGQLAKGLAKFVSWVGFLPLALRDPAGVDTALAINTKAIPPPAAIVPMPAVSILAMLLVLAGGWLALREFRLIHPATHRRYAGPVVLLTAWFLFITFGWGYLS